MPQVDELKTVADGGDKTGSDSRVTFTPVQQTKVQELIDEAYRKAFSKAQKASTTSDEVEKLKGEVESLREERKKTALFRSVSRYNVVDAEEIVKLLGESVKMDENGNATVINDMGSAVVNSSGHPLGLDEYLAHWLNVRPHHLRSTGVPGAGSQGARFGRGTVMYNLSDASTWKNIPREDLERLLEEGINVYGSAGQVYRFRDVRNPFLEARKRRFSSQGTTPM